MERSISPYRVVSQLASLGSILCREGKLRQGLDTLHLALSMAEEQDFLPITTNIYAALQAAYQDQNDYANALLYQERLQLAQSYLLNKEKINRISELEVKFETAQKEKALIEQERENLKKSRQLAQNQRTITFLLSGLILFGLLGILWVQRQQNLRLEADREMEKLQQEKEWEQLRSFFRGQEEERKRIANDLHDSLGGMLYALRLKLPTEAPGTSLVQQAIEENRRIIHDLLPPSLTHAGLIEALDEWCGTFEANWNIPIYFDEEISSDHHSLTLELAAYRIAQELTHNAAKHAEPTEIRLSLFEHESELILKVTDNGKGFDMSEVKIDAFKTLNSRTHLVNGRYVIQSEPTKGTSVEVFLPKDRQHTTPAKA
ncbi:MAG: ATP-binding protein [Bacteroidota bacterium]